MLVITFFRLSVFNRLVVFAPEDTLVLESLFLLGHVFKCNFPIIFVFKFYGTILTFGTKLFKQIVVRVIEEPVLKFTKVTTSLLQLNIGAFFLLRVKIFINFALVHLAHIARQDVSGQVAET